MPRSGQNSPLLEGLTGYAPELVGSQEVLTRMSVLLFVVGAIAAMVGVGMVGYGIPINEFSFGNTLIVAGTTAVVGGLIIIAIGARSAQLQRIAETLATRAPVRPAGRSNMFEPPAGARAAADAGPNSVPAQAEIRAAARCPANAQRARRIAVEDHPPMPPRRRCAIRTRRSPRSRNYEVKEYEDVSLSPQQPMPAPPRSSRPSRRRLRRSATMPCRSPECGRSRPSSAAMASPRRRRKPPERQSQPSYFDTMWPAEPRPAKRPASRAEAGADAELPPHQRRSRRANRSRS